MYRIYCFCPSPLGQEFNPKEVSYGESIIQLETDYRPMVGDIFIYDQSNFLFSHPDSPYEQFEGFEVEKVVIVNDKVFHCYGRYHKAIEDGTRLPIDEQGLYIGHTVEQLSAFPGRYKDKH